MRQLASIAGMTALGSLAYFLTDKDAAEPGRRNIAETSKSQIIIYYGFISRVISVVCRLIVIDVNNTEVRRTQPLRIKSSVICHTLLASLGTPLHHNRLYNTVSFITL